MEQVAQLFDEEVLDHLGSAGGGGAAIVDVADRPDRGRRRADRGRPETRRSTAFAFVPGTAHVDLAVLAIAGRVVEELIDEPRRRRDLPDREAWLAHAFERRGERLHVGDLTRHQELQRVLGAGVGGEVDQALVDDLGARLGGDVAAQIDVELAGDLQVVRRPRVPHRVVQIDAATAGDGDQRVGFGGVAVELHRFEMKSGERTDDFQVAQFLGADVHQQVLALHVVAVQALNRILHRRGEFAVGAAKLLQQHVAERRVRFVDPNRIHQLLHVVVHRPTFERRHGDTWRHRWQSKPGASMRGRTDASQ